MEIIFDDTRFEKECNDERLRIKRQGKVRAQLIGRRLDDLRAAATLDMMAGLPGNCHELSQNLAGKFAVSLDGPFRLIFAPANEPIPIKDSGGIDCSRVTAIRITGVVDYHGK